MSRPARNPDAEVLFELNSRMHDGKLKRVLSGYRPCYDVRPDYWTSVLHEFVDVEGVATGEKARAEVWFLTPDVYLRSLWVGRVLSVAEGIRPVGVANVSKVFNPVLLQDGAE
jgi:hypothetical protein